ncbi:MAG: hypothetical protein NTV49_16290 [Kiritimatiellaeota bacterium]|nr:hypothetical protein [Kiritimatiellota bacterium]
MAERFTTGAGWEATARVARLSPPAMQAAEVGGDQQRAVVQHGGAPVTEGVARKFLTVRQEAVVGTQSGGYPGALQRGGQPRQDRRLIVLRAWQKQRIVQVAGVVIHRAAAGNTARQDAAFGPQGSRMAFPPGILVLADDHRAGAAPEKQDRPALRREVQQALLQRQIAVHIQALGSDNHRFPPVAARVPAPRRAFP